jgi:peptidoglycan/LPS O-acetylase OafA/YrhL
MERTTLTEREFLSDTNMQRSVDGARLPYLPGLDGLRAVAMISVLLYHAGFSVWGGFLGVESFFALSGFLITALLLAEWRADGRISLRRFWMRRARRLLPALLLALVGTVVIAALWAPDDLARLRLDIVAALGYVINWYLIGSGQSYFDPALRPPLLQHLWSLAIEEQFYLFWPLLFGLGMRLLHRRGLLIALLVAAGASAWLMASLYDPGADPSRVYYGTDTRASALVLGSAFALLWSPWRSETTVRRGLGAALDLAGFAALAGLLLAYVRFFEYHPLLYRGGFVLVSVLTLVIVAAVTHPGARLLSAVLGAAPLRWIGVRSYAIYLWHWPIFMVTRPFIDVTLDGWQLAALRFGTTLLLADLSFRLVENPIRRGGLAPAWGRVRTAFAMRRAAPAAPTAFGQADVLETGPALVPATVSVETGPSIRTTGRKTHGHRSGRAPHGRRHHRRRTA